MTEEELDGSEVACFMLETDNSVICHKKARP